MDEDTRNDLLDRIDACSTYEEWQEGTEELDKIFGFETWRLKPESPLYEYTKVQEAFLELREARESQNWPKLLYLVRSSLSRNMGNIGDPRLYLKTFFGTKSLIEDYISECERAIAALVDCPDIDLRTRIYNLTETRRAFGRTALVLSGGSTLGLIHVGVLYELSKQNLLPKIISGSSAGSIFASLICTRRDDELDSLWAMIDRPFNIFQTFDDKETLMIHLKRFLKVGTWFSDVHIRKLMQELLDTLTFQEAYNKTGRILNVTVSPASTHDVPRLLNYITAPNVMIWSAVCASCSVPKLFSRNALLAKNPQTGEIYNWTRASFIDGSVDNDLPLARLSEMFSVNHFIACQVNPHITPFLRLSQRLEGQEPFVSVKDSLKTAHLDSEPRPRRRERWWEKARNFLRGELYHGLELLNNIGIFKTATSTLLRVISQDYNGNVTILPAIYWSDIPNLFRNSSSEFAQAAMQRGRRAVWPKLGLIHNHCAVELALDRAIIELRSRLLFNSDKSQNMQSPDCSCSSSYSPADKRRHSDDFRVLRCTRKADKRQMPFKRSSSFIFSKGRSKQKYLHRTRSLEQCSSLTHSSPRSKPPDFRKSGN